MMCGASFKLDLDMMQEKNLLECKSCMNMCVYEEPIKKAAISKVMLKQLASKMEA